MGHEHFGIAMNGAIEDPPRFETGELLAQRYRVVSRLGRGGMGEVYEVEDLELGTRVALKTVASANDSDPEAMRLFKREVLLARRVTHPSICRTFDISYHCAGGHRVAFLTMELLVGESLAARIQRQQRLPTNEALCVIEQVAAALDAAHTAGVVHGDLKSANIMIARTPEGGERSVVTDFGCARLHLKPVSEGAADATESIRGTPAYMAPEQVAGKPCGPSADLYALGIVAFEMITGTVPFRAASPMATAMQRLYFEPPRPGSLAPDLDPRWDSAILRCLDRNPDARPASGAAVVQLLCGEATAPRCRAAFPQSVTPFIGREQELEEVASLVRTSRLVTLTGAGGCGKTRLALELARGSQEASEENAWFVDLAPLTGSADVAHETALTMGLREQPGEEPAQTIIDFLQSRTALILFDNCEHVVARAAELVQRILSSTRGVRVLATSRQVLGAAGESVYPLSPLAVPSRDASRLEEIRDAAAVRLFEERARAANPVFALTDRTAATVAQICRQLDGIPLALELAAAKIRTVALAEILRRLRDRFHLLRGGGVGTREHHQTLHATIQWSHDHLSPPEAVLFRRLAVFSGGFTLEAVEAVCSGLGLDEHDVLELLTGLVDKSLVVFDPVECRYRLLETIRALSTEHLCAADESIPVAAKHQAFFLRFARDAQEHLGTEDESGWLDRLETEHDNLRAALRHDESADGPERALDLAGTLIPFWETRGYLREAREILSAAVSRAAPAGSGALRARALSGLGIFEFFLGDYPSAQQHFEESLGIRRSLDDPSAVGASLNNLALVAHVRGQYEAAQTLHEEGLTIQRQVGTDRDVAISLANLGDAQRLLGDTQAARVTLDAALEILRRLGDRRREAGVMTNLALVASAQGNLEEAWRLLDQSLAIRRELGDRWGIALTCLNLGELCLDRSDTTGASAYLVDSLTTAREIGANEPLVDGLQLAARFAASKGDPTAAARLLAAAHQLRERMGLPTAPSAHAQQDRIIASARLELGEDNLEACRAAGRGMDLGTAVALALESCRG
ncbi:MAG: tetratricopeptide repeat protein [bacterium]